MTRLRHHALALLFASLLGCLWLGMQARRVRR